MKKVLLLGIFICTLAVSLFAAFPVFEFYGNTIQNSWEEFWTLTSTLEMVPAGTDGIADAPGGDGYFGKLTGVATGYISCGKLLGDLTDTNYTLKTQMYIPVVNTDAEPDDYWYQMLIFYRDDGGYARLHAQFNTFGGAIPAPRFRLQVANPSFVSPNPGAWTAPTDFATPSASAWHEMKVEITGTTALVYYDGTQLTGTADWTATAATRAAGKYGFGQYIDGAGTRSIYIDQFKAYQGTEPPLPTATPTPAPTITPAPTPFTTDAKNWSHYE